MRFSNKIVNVDSFEFLRGVDVDSLFDVSDIHSAYIFRVQIIRVDECSCPNIYIYIYVLVQ
jgi:hypothetical protein